MRGDLLGLGLKFEVKFGIVCVFGNRYTVSGNVSFLVNRITKRPTKPKNVKRLKYVNPNQNLR